MDLLVGIANLVVLLFIIEAWVKGRIPGALARTTSEHVDERFNAPASPANVRLDDLARRLGALDTRLGGLDTRLDALDTRLDRLDTRLDRLDRRVSALDDRVAALDDRLDRVDAQVAVLNAQTSQQLGDLDRRVREWLRSLDRHERAPKAEAGGAAAGTP